MLAYEFLGELAMVRDDVSIPGSILLLRSLVEARVESRIIGVYYLGEIGRKSAAYAIRVVYPLIHALDNCPPSTPNEEYHVLHALVKIDKSSKQVRDILASAIWDVAYLQASKVMDEDEETRAEAIWKISRLGEISFDPIIDLIPLLIERVTDESELVRKTLMASIIRIFKIAPAMVFEILLDQFHHQFFYVKLGILKILKEIGVKSPEWIEKIVPIGFSVMNSNNRQMYLEAQVMFKKFQELKPDLFVKYRDLLFEALKSENRYAYHWAIKTFSSTYLERLRKIAKENIAEFINTTLFLAGFFTRFEDGKIMQTRIILMMLVHETRELLLNNGSIPESLAIGLNESLAQIQRSELNSKNEVLAAFEKFRQIMKNTLLFIQDS